MEDYVKIRPSKKADFQQLMTIDHLIWNETNTPSSIYYESVEEYGNNHAEGSQFVAEIAGSVAGYIGFRHPTPLETNRHVLELDIGIHPDFQRKGVGKALMNFIESWARTNGIRKITVRVLDTNPTAISFYKKNGFVEQGRLVDEFFINGKYVDDLFLYKKI
ncbi:GNAT family N-acetyltransferase [Pallidibacillus pasinlerensis]|uniref:GNAT family N-acetyltransferase n=1 Tax=Pallidibacillus pasinlerensis TaxID=2703818 RepID=A0ABX0ABK5_9BACI|nr:GNAT family N-acetyltransferase [Pallidibacillus pasinlerensis]NCU18442.1 GNAT family N-acetyltransferase [Pallidibacillus pasinlerensis]